ncbi:hypothetical protein [Bathymodiolus septemdierum thioautotrophic gill symbiont]|uniref:Uncharacterized protein n=1 Tax=endosymbiont of Bathymodiolus septemdierum str. Myojin knoll TaxID=1303921 RepID=A0A0P0URM9_9GAMM|nr:hypothetical protein [Bathymodiolus septemdierum thioautotrophic gill symbiont]BAS67905.1 conserved hypothetical protein [endosymbiont of Bathymodiolus septemdierum str. Myojin knoll]
MIKYLLGIVIILALIGGAVQFKSTDKDWSLVVNKEIAASSVKTGAVKIYDFVAEMVAKAKKENANEEATPVEAR